MTDDFDTSNERALAEALDEAIEELTEARARNDVLHAAFSTYVKCVEREYVNDDNVTAYELHPTFQAALAALSESDGEQ